MLEYPYDAFGNITKTSSGPGISFMPNYDTSKNWITSLPGPITTNTDANGQMTYDGTHNYTWDAEGNMHSVDANPSNCTTSGQCLTYDALGRMVEKAVGSTYTQIVYGPQGRFALMNGQTLQKAFIPLPGALAVYTSTGLTYYRHSDHLGSSRLATTPSRTMYSSTAYAPYGEPYTQAGTTDLSFTGQDQDTVSGIHDFLARKYPPVQGRWLAPDPAGLGAVDPASPQSWNRYAYVLNNPLSLVDPLGLYCVSGTISGGGGTYRCSSDASLGYYSSGQPNLAGITGSEGTGMFCEGDPACGGSSGGWGGGGMGILPGESLGIPTGFSFDFSLGASGVPCGDFVQCGSLGPGNSFAQAAAPAIGVCAVTPGCQEVLLGALIFTGAFVLTEVAIDAVREAKCEAQHRSDLNQCRSLPNPAARARCYDSADNRLGACLQGNTLPPFNYLVTR